MTIQKFILGSNSLQGLLFAFSPSSRCHPIDIFQSEPVKTFTLLPTSFKKVPPTDRKLYGHWGEPYFLWYPYFQDLPRHWQFLTRSKTCCAKKIKQIAYLLKTFRRSVMSNWKKRQTVAEWLIRRFSSFAKNKVVAFDVLCTIRPKMILIRLSAWMMSWPNFSFSCYIFISLILFGNGSQKP